MSCYKSALFLFPPIMKSHREEVRIRASLTESLLSMVRYSCPRVYNKSCFGLPKPLSVRVVYV